MNISFLFTSGLIAIILLLIGLLTTFWEYHKMHEHSEDYIDEPNKNVVTKQKKKR